MAYVVGGPDGITTIDNEGEIASRFEEWLKNSKTDGEIEDYDRCPGVLAWDIELADGLFVQVTVR